MKKIGLVLCICALMLCACSKTTGGSNETEADTKATAAESTETESVGAEAAEDKGTLILATTTSTKDSGLLDAILPDRKSVV